MILIEYNILKNINLFVNEVQSYVNDSNKVIEYDLISKVSSWMTEHSNHYEDELWGEIKNTFSLIKAQLISGYPINLDDKIKHEIDEKIYGMLCYVRNQINYRAIFNSPMRCALDEDSFALIYRW